MNTFSSAAALLEAASPEQLRVFAYIDEHGVVVGTELSRRVGGAWQVVVADRRRLGAAVRLDSAWPVAVGDVLDVIVGDERWAFRVARVDNSALVGWTEVELISEGAPRVRGVGCNECGATWRPWGAAVFTGHSCPECGHVNVSPVWLAE